MSNTVAAASRVAFFRRHHTLEQTMKTSALARVFIVAIAGCQFPLCVCFTVHRRGGGDMLSLRNGPTLLTRATKRTPIASHPSRQQTRRQPPIFHHEYRSLETQLRDRGSPEDTGSTGTGEILYLVLPLLLVYISNQWSRYSISYLVDFSSTDGALNSYQAMNVDLHFDQSQYGLLASTAFTILFALSSLLAGSLADKYDRKLLTMGSCGVWTMATLAQSQASTYNDVLIARIIMGGACAFAAPAAYTLISEKVSKDKLALANSFYGSGVYLGGALASLSLLLDNNFGWRTTLETIAGFGFVSVMVAGLALPSDSIRNINGAESEEKSKKEGGLLSDASGILSIPRVQFIFLASFVRFCSGLLIGVWAAPYYKQAFPDSSAEYALINAIIVGAGGMSSGILGGYIADSLGTRIKDSRGSGSLLQRSFDESNIGLLLPIVGNLLAIPSWYLTMHSVGSEESFKVAMFWLAIEYLVAECWFGPTIAVLQSTVGKSRTGTAQGLFVLTGALGNIAPTLLGIIYSSNSQIGESGGSSPEVLADYLTYGVCAGYLLSSLFFALSVRASSHSREEIN